MKMIESPDAINLNQHAVIEASAGTGKTYTITHLVLRYLLVQRLPISQILLVTFTDKATSELKDRIHEVISDKLSDSKTSLADKGLLQQALTDLPLASIYTIHGFCQRVLKEYAFEQGSVLDKSLVDDNTVHIKQLQSLKRTWPAIGGIVEKLNKTKLSMQQLDKLLIDLAKQYKAGDVFYPDSPTASLNAVKEALAEYTSPDLPELKKVFETMNGLTTRIKNNRLKKFFEVIEILNRHEVLSITTAMLSNDFTELKKLFDGVLSDSELEEVIAANEDTDIQLFLNTYQQIKSLLKAYQLALQADQYQFIIEMVHTLKSRVKQHKVSQGQISYDDMIIDLADALQAESGSEDQPLTQRLRAKYQVALIDEFQDTDAQQWAIFQWLFTDTDEAHRLVLIGDPKQSIYGFRGANIYTYEAAKSYLINAEHQGLGYRLSTNFRALPELTEQLNQFFTHHSQAHSAWYPVDEAAVSSPSQSKREDIGGPLLLADDSGLSAVNAITVEGEGLLVAELKQKMATQIARLIQQQLIGRVEFMRKSVVKRLDASDVCVLVRNKKEAWSIEQALDDLKIPHSFYKKTHLYQSEAAIQIQLILTALAFPQMKKQVNNAWLSLFFNLSAEQIKRLKDQQGVIDEDATLSECFAWWLKLKDLAAQQDWIAVFNVLFEETGTCQRLYANGQWRMLANLQQIKQELLRFSIEQQLDAHGMLHLLLSSRSSQLISNEDLQQKDTESPAVQIMTIHSSKGLEFPVVFLFGGYSAPGHLQEYCKYHDPATAAQVFDLTDKKAKLYLAETEAENKRLYYVAMTRAVLKLFVPTYESSTYQTKLGDVFYKDQVVDRLMVSGLASAVPQLAHDSEQPSFKQPSASSLLPPQPVPALPSDVFSKSRLIHSFSSLQRHHAEGVTHFGDFNAIDPVQADDVNPDQTSLVDEKPSIPGGAQTGNVLHGIFEHLDFKIVAAHNNLHEFQQDQLVINVIESQMKAFLMTDGEILDTSGQLHSTYRNEFAAWVWHTLKKPIDALGGMPLCELSETNRRHEMSFYWSHSGHVLTGFIDLLFKVAGPEGDRYYILDWKSNYNAGGYAPKALAEQVMQAHNYHDQYRWYTLAIKAWFNSLKLENASLAGALYVFSRGIDSQTNDQNGVFYQNLTTDSYHLNHLEQQLISRIGAIHHVSRGAS